MTTKITLLCSGPNEGLFFRLDPGQRSDSKAGQDLLNALPQKHKKGALLIMDRGYEGAPMRNLAKEKGFKVVVPPKKNRTNPWAYDKSAYALRNKVERLFHRVKNFRRIATRYDKLDLSYASFFALALFFLFFKFM